MDESGQKPTRRRRADSGGTELPVCPYLGLPDDPSTCAVYPRADHVCALPKVPPPSTEWQLRYCLTGAHVECPHIAARREMPLAGGRGATARRAGKLIAITSAGLAAVLGISGAIAFGIDWPPPSGASQDAATAASATVATITVPLMTPTLGMKSTATPVATPAAVLTGRPATHTVVAGETLSGIAARYGTTVEALVELNGIDNPRHIYAGLVLQLPTEASPAASP